MLPKLSEAFGTFPKDAESFRTMPEGSEVIGFSFAGCGLFSGMNLALGVINLREVGAWLFTGKNPVECAIILPHEAIGEILKESNIVLDTLDPVARGGFTQVPNFILKMADLSVGAKVTYAMFLSYAWHNDNCFPGQERLAEDMGMSRSRVTEFVTQLEKAGLISIQRRGQGRTNLYTVHFNVKPKSGGRPPEVGRPTSRSRWVYH